MAIQNNDCEAAVVIATTTHHHPSGQLFRSQAGIASPSGKCIPFSEWADGYVPSEGAVAVVIQKVQHMQVSPYASIRASAVSQDGASHGFFAPNPVAQARVLRIALKKAGLRPCDISFIEGTCT